MTTGKKNLFIQGRPSGHPLHVKYGESVDSEFMYVDYILRWHDRHSSRSRKYLSWMLCALFLPKKRSYEVVISEGPHFMVGLLKWLRLLKQKQKTIALLDNETLYFIDSGYYPNRTRKALLKLIRSYDGIISAGKMEADLARKYASEKAIVKQIFNGVEDQRLKKLLALKPNHQTHNIVFIGNIGAGWRSWYKGVDLLLESFDLAWQQNKKLKLQLVGEWDTTYLHQLIGKHAKNSKDQVEYVGYTKALDTYLCQAGLYLHPARGEAWGISVTEAMAAGVMPLVSNWTGSQEVVANVDPTYVVELDKEKIANKVLEHFALNETIRKNQSVSCKEVAAAYSETRAIAAFQTAVGEITDTFKSAKAKPKKGGKK